MNLKKAICSYVKETDSIKVDDKALDRVIQKSKEAFWIGESERYISWPEFLYQQMFYIKKIWWLLQAGLMALLWLLLKFIVSGMYVERCMGITAPVFIIMILPELWKNDTSQSLEIEGAALFPLRKIVAARMILFGMVDSCLLTIFIVLGITSTNVSALEMLIQFVLPMVVTTCICLRLFSGRYCRGVFPAVTASLFWLTVWTLIVLRDDIYSMISMPVWIGTLILTLFYLCYCVYRILRDTEQIYISC